MNYLSGNYLSEIVTRKKIEILELQEKTSITDLKNSFYFKRNCISLRDKLINSNKSEIIAEFKRSSPSLGQINLEANIKDVVTSYEAAGACAVSILTDEEGFGGNSQDILNVREFLKIPILRKEFIVDEYQIYETKALGADVILLIAACLTLGEVKHFSSLAKSVGLEVLLEIHGEDELSYLGSDVDILGVNNRDLETFKVSLEASKKIASLMAEKIKSKSIVMISESGLKSSEEVNYLNQLGYKGFLIGETFMREGNPGEECARLIKEINS